MNRFERCRNHLKNRVDFPFYYLKRERDGAVLLKRDRAYWQFDSEAEARDYAAAVGEPVIVRFMPLLRPH